MKSYADPRLLNINGMVHMNEHRRTNTKCHWNCDAVAYLDGQCREQSLHSEVHECTCDEEDNHKDSRLDEETGLDFTQCSFEDI